MEGHCLTDQSPQWDVVPMEKDELKVFTRIYNRSVLTDYGLHMLVSQHNLLWHKTKML
jgi:hypothetical protein